MTSHSIRSTAPAAALLAMALAGCSGIGSDGRLREDPLGNIEQRVIGDTLSGLGVVAPRRERIDYAPRGPLAMPPRGAAANNQLPAPQAAATTQAPPNWPRDPDVARREAAQREASRPRDHNWERERDGRRMTIEEMEAQRNIGPRATGGPNEPFRERNVVLGREDLERGWQSPSSGNSIFTVDETVDMTRGRQEDGQGAARRYLDEQNGQNAAQRGSQRIDTSRLASQPQEPPRRSLVDPPSGLRTPAHDPTGGAVTATDRQNQNLWDRLFGR